MEVIVITGASAGVGRATAKEFAKLECKIALLARGRAGLEAAKKDVEELGGTAVITGIFLYGKLHKPGAVPADDFDLRVTYNRIPLGKVLN